MPSSPKKSIDLARQNLIKKARKDLAQRLSISATQINVLEVKNVVWPDSSLGCPQPGVTYMQVLTQGYLILLGHNEIKFEYHANNKNSLIYCENPSSPILNTSVDT